jgi:hypothetical protein
VFDGVVVAALRPTGTASGASECVGEFALALLDGGDALAQLAAKTSELLLDGDRS